MQTASIKRKTDTELHLKNCRTHTCHSFTLFDDEKLNALCQFVLKNDGCGGHVDPDGRFSWEGFKASISEGWNDNGLSGAVSGGLNNLGENFSNYFDGKGFSDNRELTRSLIFDGKHLLANDGYGNFVSSWRAKTGKLSEFVENGKTPQGNYSVKSLLPSKNSRMIGNNGDQWKAHLKYEGINWPKARHAPDFFIHPDTGSDGTYGCIGVNPNESLNFQIFLKSYLENVGKINVEVKY